jgi:hypothetical protein
MAKADEGPWSRLAGQNMKEMDNLFCILGTHLSATHSTQHRMQHVFLLVLPMLLLSLVFCSFPLSSLLWLAVLQFTSHQLVLLDVTIEGKHGPVLGVVNRMLLTVDAQGGKASRTG